MRPGCTGPACRCDGAKEQVCLQAEQERGRILQRLREARAARTKPHEPRWFTLNPEVRSCVGAVLPSFTMPAINLASYSMHNVSNA